jgi:hypothetical protein
MRPLLNLVAAAIIAMRAITKVPPMGIGAWYHFSKRRDHREKLELIDASCNGSLKPLLAYVIEYSFGGIHPCRRGIGVLWATLQEAQAFKLRLKERSVGCHSESTI